MTQSIADKIDELLKSDATFTTRAGMRFMTEVIRDAFQFIEDEKKRNKEADQAQSSILTRLTQVETGLNNFLKMRKIEQDKAEEERKWWRRAIFAPLIVMVLSELLQWLAR